MKYLVWLLVFSFTIPAFAQKTKPRKPASAMPATSKAATPAAATEPVLVVQRTPCHGTCPTYTAAIYPDGRVDYEGVRFVALVGKHTLHLPVATVNQLLAEAKRINFTQFKDKYVGDTYDLPATIITVHPVGQPAKTVHAQQNIPPALDSYASLLARQLDPLANGLTDK